jgi:hypothetical protein
MINKNAGWQAVVVSHASSRYTPRLLALNKNRNVLKKGTAFSIHSTKAALKQLIIHTSEHPHHRKSSLGNACFFLFVH